MNNTTLRVLIIIAAGLSIIAVAYLTYPMNHKAVVIEHMYSKGDIVCMRLTNEKVMITEIISYKDRLTVRDNTYQQYWVNQVEVKDCDL